MATSTINRPQKVSLTKSKLNAALAMERVPNMATAQDTAMNRQLIRENGYDRMFVSSKDFPKDIIAALKRLREGPCVHVSVNRAEGKLQLISEEEFGKLEWYEWMVIWKDCLPKIKAGLPLALDVYCVYINRTRLVLNGDYNSNDVARVAQLEPEIKPAVKPSHGRIKTVSQVNAMLRNLDAAEKRLAELSETVRPEQLKPLKALIRSAKAIKA